MDYLNEKEKFKTYIISWLCKYCQYQKKFARQNSVFIFLKKTPQKNKKKMQREIGDKIQLRDTLNLLNDVSAVPAVDNESNLKDFLGKIGKLGYLWEKGKADASLIRYLSGGSEVSREGKIFNIVPKRTDASSIYIDKKALTLNLQLSQQQIRIQTTA